MFSDHDFRTEFHLPHLRNVQCVVVHAPLTTDRHVSPSSKWQAARSQIVYERRKKKRKIEMQKIAKMSSTRSSVHQTNVVSNKLAKIIAM